MAGQFLLESTTIGLLGGVIGAAGGITVVVGVAVAKHWTPALDLNPALGAPVAGALVALLAGLCPSVRAAGLEPSGRPARTFLTPRCGSPGRPVLPALMWPLLVWRRPQEPRQARGEYRV